MSREEFRKEHMLNLKGKEYLPVAARIVEFRKDHPDWTIETRVETETLKEKLTLFVVCSIYCPSGSLPIATARKTVQEKGKGAAADWPMETAETGAVGRALGLCGYGTLGCPDWDEGDQLADAPVAPSSDVQHLHYAVEAAESLEDLKANREQILSLPKGEDRAELVQMYKDKERALTRKR